MRSHCDRNGLHLHLHLHLHLREILMSETYPFGSSDLIDREISTPRQTTPRIDFHRFGRIYLRIVSSLLAAQSYDSIADLMEDAKRSCARARVPYDSQHLADAIRDIWHTRRGARVVTGVDVPKKATAEPPLLEAVPDMPRDEAAAFLTALRSRPCAR